MHVLLGISVIDPRVFVSRMVGMIFYMQLIGLTFDRRLLKPKD